MKKSMSWIIPLIIILAAATFLLVMGGNDGPPYVSNSRGDLGASVLYDTLNALGFNVGRSQRPLTTRTSLDDAYIIIRPRSPRVNEEMAEVMLEWVYMGGRLIFLNSYPLMMDRLIDGPGENVHGFTLYRHGQGEVLTGSASSVLNINLAERSQSGHGVFLTLYGWDPQRVRFADYYHGLHAGTTLVGRLPLVVQLFLLQSVIFAIILIWYLGKRFGAVVPYYEIIEREENEYLRSLARLYYLTGKKKRRKKDA